jgi:hypothetical protein
MISPLLEMSYLVVSHACVFSIGYLVAKSPRNLNEEKSRQPFCIIRSIDHRRCPECGLMREHVEETEEWKCPGDYLH